MSRLLIVGALKAEVAPLRELLRPHVPAGLELEIDTIGVGKPHAAAATQRLLLTHRPSVILFAGVAGSLAPELRIGDLGIVSAAIDADLDVRNWRPEMRRGEHPITRERVYTSHPGLVSAALSAAHSLTGSRATIFDAYAASGSLFFDTPAKANFIAKDLPELEANLQGTLRSPNVIDMETSAFLQVAAENRTPALALRAISDTTEGDAVADFELFLRRASHAYAEVIAFLLPKIRSI